MPLNRYVFEIGNEPVTLTLIVQAPSKEEAAQLLRDSLPLEVSIPLRPPAHGIMSATVDIAVNQITAKDLAAVVPPTNIRPVDAPVQERRVVTDDDGEIDLDFDDSFGASADSRLHIPVQ